MPDGTAIFWFRRDLRLTDNPGLSRALQHDKVCLVYILEEESEPEIRRIGAASRWWLHHSLLSLDASIRNKGGRLILRNGDAQTILPRLIEETGATAVYWNRRYTAGRNIDAALKTQLKGDGIAVDTFNASLLTEPFAVKTKTGAPYKVFTPFWKAVEKSYQPPPAHRPPARLETVNGVHSDPLASWRLLPTTPDWSAGIQAKWAPGETAAHKTLEYFLENTVTTYPVDRDFPARSGVSNLSPYLAFGEISPAQIWRATTAVEAIRGAESGTRKFLSEVAWRDFAYHLLFNDPDMSRLSWKREYEKVPWRSPNSAEWHAWTKGQTGFPIVDAGMRELWATGWMHNRVRMICASFLTKDLLAHWKSGEEWFWDTLVDADEASNAFGWQWTAGSGADAAPYFRVFNPIAQGEKFDPEGEYVRKWIPELAGLPTKWVHRPWEAPQEVLDTAGIQLNGAYPAPILDHSAARKRALDAYALKNE